jgi:hypothetical protein
MGERAIVVMCRPVPGGRPHPVVFRCKTVPEAIAEATKRGLEPTGEVLIEEVDDEAPADPCAASPAGSALPGLDPRKMTLAKIADGAGVLLALASLAPLVYLAELGFPGARRFVYFGVAIMAVGTLLVLARPRINMLIVCVPLVLSIGYFVLLSRHLESRRPRMAEAELQMYRTDFQRGVRRTEAAQEREVRMYLLVPLGAGGLAGLALRLRRVRHPRPSTKAIASSNEVESSSPLPRLDQV